MTTLAQSGVDAGHIAVIGLACRYAGARDADQFWRNLKNGTESLQRLSREDLLAAGEPPEVIDDPAYVPVHGRLDRAAEFDAALFGYSPREAALIDPQQRVFLECAWEALEDAGCDPHQYDGEIGVYAGSPLSTYAILLYLREGRSRSMAAQYQYAISTGPDHISTRTSYKLGLAGPSITVLATCATSLVAIHQACQSLIGGECDVTLAGGASIRTPPRGYLYTEGAVGSPDGHVRAFDAGAAGTVGGDGVGVVVLKRLADALSDGDHIRAVVTGSAVNNLGRERVGYTAPSIAGQTRVIRRAQILADVDPATISYVETHGTGTAMGDPIEVAALTRAFRARSDGVGFCAIGSVKTNIGHTDAAAGVASFIKTVLALENEALPPSLNFEEPNPEIDFASSPFFVNTELREWKANGIALRAGVSSFGIGGTNAHVILEQVPAIAPSGPALPKQLVVLSARTPTALVEATRRLAVHLDERPDVNLPDLAYTLQTGRQALSDRRFAVCSDTPDLIEVLDDTITRAAKAHELGRMVHARQRATERDVIFMFPGQGSQRVGMGHSLYSQLPEFRRYVDQCSDMLLAPLGADIREILFQRSGGQARELVDETAYSQPALFVVEYSLAKLLMDWGVKPTAMIGHSLGEYVAACLAGVFTLEDALRLTVERGGLIQNLPAGAMLAVSLSEAELAAMLEDETEIAVVNGADRCVVSGPEAQIDQLAARLEMQGAPGKRLRVHRALHSAMMDPVLDTFEECVRRARRQSPGIAYVSNVTGTWVTPDEVTDPGYWRRHLRGTVRFADGLSVLMAEADRVLVEVGPGKTLTTFARQHASSPLGSRAVSTLEPPKEHTGDELASVLTAIGNLWALGTRIDWPHLHSPGSRRRIPLPTYPFEKQHYLIDLAELLATGSVPRAVGGSLPAIAPIATTDAAPAQTNASETSAEEGSRGSLYDQVVAIFADVLGIDSLRPDDDFFGLGGDSLTATLVTTRVRDELAIDAPLETIFDFTTAAEFVREIGGIAAERGHLDKEIQG